MRWDPIFGGKRKVLSREEEDEFLIPCPQFWVVAALFVCWEWDWCTGVAMGAVLSRRPCRIMCLVDHESCFLMYITVTTRAPPTTTIPGHTSEDDDTDTCR